MKKYAAVIAGIFEVVTGGFMMYVSFIGFLVAPVFVPVFLPGILAIVGGVHALRQKNWSLAFAGSMATAFTMLFFIAVFVLDSSSPALLIIPVLLGATTASFTILSEKVFEPPYVPESRMNRGWLSVLSGVAVIASGVLQITVATINLLPLISGETIIMEKFVFGRPHIGSLEFYYILALLATGITEVSLGGISIFRPQKWDLAVYGALLAVVPLGLMVILGPQGPYAGYGPHMLLVAFIFVGLAAALLIYLSKFQW